MSAAADGDEDRVRVYSTRWVVFYLYILIVFNYCHCYFLIVVVVAVVEE